MTLRLNDLMMINCKRSEKERTLDTTAPEEPFLIQYQHFKPYFIQPIILKAQS
jgi:hypothetical protein